MGTRKSNSNRSILAISLFVWSVFTGAGYACLSPGKAAIRATTEQVADYWIEHHLSENPDADWIPSVLFAGIMALDSISEQQTYYKRAHDWADNLNWQIQYALGPNRLIADDQMCGQTYFDLYLSQPSPEKIASIQRSVDGMLSDPESDDWYWIDAIFMAAPVFSRLGWLYDDPAYYRKMYQLYRHTKVERGLFDSEDNLWIRDENYNFKTPNGRKIFWSRGNGWVIGSLPRILNYLVDNEVTRPMDVGMDGIAVSSSSYVRPSAPENTLDGDLSTRWSAKGKGASIEFDLGGVESVSNIGIAFFRGDQRRAYFSVDVSKDGQNWTRVITNGISSGSSLDIETFEFDRPSVHGPDVDVKARCYPDVGVKARCYPDVGVKARYLKIIGHGNSQNAWNSFTQVEIQTPMANEFIGLLIDMAEALKDRQRPDGFWNVSLDDDRHYCGPETTGTALFVYAMAWGINNGYLDRDAYLPVVARAWNGMVREAVHPSGKLGFVQRTGKEPRDQQPVSRDSTIDFGVGVFLLAGSEVYKLPYVLETTVSASTHESGNPPINTMDNDLATRWSAEGRGQWIQYDLGRDKKMDRIDIAFFRGDERQAFFDVAISENATEWTAVISNGQSSGMTNAMQSFLFPNEVTARYVRIIGAGNTQNSWNSFTQVHIPAWSVAERVMATYYECPNAPENAFDGDPTTRWSSEGFGEWIEYDLGKVYTVDQINIAFYRGDQRLSYFDVELSINRKDWIAAIIGMQSSGTSLDAEAFDLGSQKARYVRVIGHGNSENEWNSITEIDFRMTPTND